MLIAQLLTSVFLSMLFLQSGIDKLIDWQGNYKWLKTHFEDSYLKQLVKPMLTVITICEIATGAVSVIGAILLLVNGSHSIAFSGVIMAAFTLLLLFFGQRMAKDYEGAATLAIYFVLILAGLIIHHI